MQSVVLNPCRSQACNFSRVIPEIDIWRAANLMLKRYGDKALEESAGRADELAADGDHNGAATWRRITDAVVQLANQTPPGPVTDRKGKQPGCCKGTSAPALAFGFILDNIFYNGLAAHWRPAVRPMAGRHFASCHSRLAIRSRRFAPHPTLPRWKEPSKAEGTGCTGPSIIPSLA
jgi:hypothetical protein